MCLVLIFYALKERKIAVGTWTDYVSRMIFIVVIQYCINKDLGPVQFNNAIINLNLFTHDGNMISRSLMVRNFRKVFNHVLMVMIPFYILTTSPDEGEEGPLDLV